jgi:predicted amidohydrolase
MKMKKQILIIIVLMILFIQPQKSVSEMKTIKVAMCQIFCLDDDKEGNFVRIENAIIEAKQNGADIACFPETALLGWVNPNAHKKAFSIPGENSRRLCRLAKKYQLYLCIGLAEKDGEELYDSVILINSNGNILLKHRKINILTELMTPPYTPGSDINIVETEFGRIGLLICADTFRNELLKKMSNLNPDLVLVPYGWAADEKNWPGHGKQLLKTVTKAAQQIKASVVGTDLVGEIAHGPWTGKVYGGQSVAVDAKGNVLGIAKDRDRDVKIIKIILHNVK